MLRAVAVLLLIVSVSGPTWAATYQVTNKANSGAGSLRQAILDANAHLGADRITFAAGLSGKTIAPSNPLPSITDAGTTIDGDINDDGAPDIRLNGSLAGAGVHGLDITGDDCAVRGLAIGAFDGYGLNVSDASGCVIQACHLGVSLGGNAQWANATGDARLLRCTDCLVGGTTPAERNIVGGGLYGYGVSLDTSSDCTISGNYFGLRRTGGAALGEGEYGVTVWGASTTNTIGGAAPGAGNVFGGLGDGIILVSGADRNLVAGNLFGLAADGDTEVPIESYCIFLGYGADHNTIGGTTAAARNVFAAADVGVEVVAAGTKDNAIRGNYFGTNATGDAARDLEQGIRISSDAESQIIGGNTAAAGNYFIPTRSGIQHYDGAGAGTLVRHNKFGVFPSGQDAAPGLNVYGVFTDTSGKILNNTFASLAIGVFATGSTATPQILGNRFRGCYSAVRNGFDARCFLGNLGNAATNDDGGNVFAPSNTWHIRNGAANSIKAEGNDFRTTSRAEINAKIWDGRDDSSLGRVDFDPLDGDITPTGDTGAALAVTGATVVATARGAEIVFTLSAPAEVTVTVLNIAGRPVATIARERVVEAGLQRLVWNGQSVTGTRAPDGVYLVSIEARSATGQTSRALTRLTLGR